MVDPKWQALAEEMKEFGCNYTAEQLNDPDWCAKELARLGYSITYSYITLESATALRGEPPAIPEAFPNWTYQLWGPRYSKRGNHDVYAVPDLNLAGATALYNICRLNWQDMQETKNG
jgi:hypothetical protein